MAYIVGIDRNQTRMVTSSLDDLIDENNSVRVIFVRYAIEFLIIIRKIGRASCRGRVCLYV